MGSGGGPAAGAAGQRSAMQIRLGPDPGAAPGGGSRPAAAAGWDRPSGGLEAGRARDRVCNCRYDGSPGAGVSAVPELPPARPEQQRPLEPRNREVQIDMQVEVVASDRSVDEVLGEREHDNAASAVSKVRSDVGERS